MRQIAFLKKVDDKGRELFHVNVRATPNGKVLGILEPGVLFQLTGQERSTATVAWVEGHFAGVGKITRGWVAKKYLAIRDEPDTGIKPIQLPELPDRPISWIWILALAAFAFIAALAYYV